MSPVRVCLTCDAEFIGTGERCFSCRTRAGEAFPAAEAPSPLQPGQVFHGLEILESLGQGGMGLVYKARQVRLDRVVALKLLLPGSAENAELQARFEREAKTLAALSHPHIVGVHDFGRDPFDSAGGEPSRTAQGGKGLFYLVMEYVEGASLRTLLERKEISRRRTVPLLLQMCDALDYAHGKGVVHRDIKPDNILIDERDVLKIADFGLAKLAGDSLFLTRSHMAMGTAFYMAPEQVESTRDVDHRADLYSLGAVFFAMLTGRPPRGKVPPVDPALDPILSKALARDVTRRYQTAREFKEDLERAATVALADKTILEGAIPETPRPRKPPTTSHLPLPEEVKPLLDRADRRLNQYVCVEQVGAGGMGAVWKGWDTNLARWVAVKLLSAAGEESIARFRREAQLAAQLRHPNIAQIHEVNEAGGLHFLVMDFIDGRSLAKTALPPRRAIEVFAKVCRAVAFAHARSIIHRDIKPANIMLGADGEPFVTDFGLAKVMARDSSISASGAILGTPLYMSPEQATGTDSRAIDARTDIYSLGATLYFVLTGRPPFEGDNATAVLYKVAHEEPARLRQIDPEIPPPVEAIVLKAMEKSKERRYPDAGEMADDLERFLSREAVRARPRRRRRRLFVLIGAAALLVTTAAVAFVLLRPRRGVEPPQPRPNLEETWRRRFDALKPGLAFYNYEKPSSDLVRRARAALDEMPPSVAEETAAWFEGQSRLLPRAVWPKRDWLRNGEKARRIHAWCADVAAILEGRPGQYASIRTALAETGRRFLPAARYRGKITLKIFLWPYMELRDCRVGEEWIVREGKKTRSDAAIAGDDLSTPLLIGNLDIGETVLILTHPKLGRREYKFGPDGLKHGRTYLFSGVPEKPGSVRLRAAP